jgi:hypothetical protein
MKFLIFTIVAQGTQLGWLANEVGDALSHPRNFITADSAIRAFAEVIITFNFPT